MSSINHPRVQYRCSFCAKSQEQVHRLIAGPGGVYICDECVGLCQDIITEEGGRQEPKRAPDAHEDIGRQAHDLWNSKAAFWDESFGEGNQFHKQLVEPTALRLLDVRPDQTILEIACGNGAFSRTLVALGARVVATDFSEVFIERARARTTEHGQHIEYHVVDATDRDALLSLGEVRFDSAVGNMALMDIADIEPLASTLPLLLKPGAHAVFTVQHPCFNSNGISLVAEESMERGTVVMRNAVKVSGYLDVPPGEGGGMPGEPNPHIYFHRPLNELLGTFFRHGFVLDGLEEPTFHHVDQPLSWIAVGGQIPPVLAIGLRSPVKS